MAELLAVPPNLLLKLILTISLAVIILVILGKMIGINLW